MLKDFLRFVLGLIAPFILILVGAGLFALGIEYKTTVLLWIGGVVAICGVLWGIFLMLWAAEA